MNAEQILMLGGVAFFACLAFKILASRFVRSKILWALSATAIGNLGMPIAIPGAVSDSIGQSVATATSYFKSPYTAEADKSQHKIFAHLIDSRDHN